MAVLLLLTAAALGQAAAPETPQAGEAPQVDRNLLAGPTVEDAAVADAADAVSRRPGAKRALSVRPQQWFAIVRQLDLTPNQQAKINAIVNEFRTARQDFRRKHGGTLRAAQEQLRRSKREGEMPHRQESLQRMQRLAAAWPRAEAYQRRIWNELTPEQQQVMRAKLDRLERQMNERRKAHAQAGLKDSGARWQSQHMGDGDRTAAEPSVKKAPRGPRLGKDAKLDHRKGHRGEHWPGRARRWERPMEDQTDPRTSARKPATNQARSPRTGTAPRSNDQEKSN